MAGNNGDFSISFNRTGNAWAIPGNYDTNKTENDFTRKLKESSIFDIEKSAQAAGAYCG